MQKTKLTADIALCVTVIALSAGAQQVPTVHQTAKQSSCSNIVALSGAKIDCTNLTLAQKKALEKLPAIMKKALENQDSLDAIVKRLDEMQKVSTSLRFDHIEIIPREECGIRALAPKGSTARLQADKWNQDIEKDSPELGKWSCIRMVFVNNGTLPINNVRCRVSLVFSNDPKLPPDSASSDVLEGSIYKTPYKYMIGTDEERQPGDSVGCTSENFPEEAIRRIREGTMALGLYGVAKYKSNSIPLGMVGVTEVGRYFINNLDQSLPVGNNRIAVDPDQ